MLKRLAISTLCCAAMAAPATSATFTEISDAFTRGDDETVDLTLDVNWEFLQRDGKIRREFRCLRDDADVANLCADGSAVVPVNEMQVRRIIHRLNVDASVAFWRYAQLSLRLPIVLLDQTALRFDEGITTVNSTVDASNRPSLFELPYTGTKRTGLGDLRFGMRFAPLNVTRDDTQPSWAVNIDLTVPTAEVKSPTNNAPGLGLWQIDVNTALSTRFTSWLEPYFQVGGVFRVPTASSDFEEYGNTQTLVSPGHSIGIALGTEFVPYEDHGNERSFTIDIGGSVDFRFEGRERTDLFEALGTSSCDARAAEPCELTTFSRGDVDPNTNRRRKTDGITDVEQYATFKTWVNLRYQVIRNLKLNVAFWFAHETPHFITTADAGEDLDNSGQVEESNDTGANEFNPVYSDHFDALGTRFMTANTLLFGANVSLMGKF